jgi:hypothetical protein
MDYHEAKKIMGNQSTYAIRNMVKALSLPISTFLNTDEDNKRLQAGKIVLEREKTVSQQKQVLLNWYDKSHRW